MNLLKKLFALTLVLVGVVALAGCERTERPLVVGTPAISGDFVAGFGSSAYDVYVRDLIHGYGTLVETKAGEFVWDTAAVLVAAPTVTTDAQGNKTYTFELQDDLKWNTGDAITAKDYVAMMLLRSSKDWTSIATSANAGYYLVGFEDYRYGPFTLDEEDKKVYDDAYTVLDQPFAGVRLISATKFSLTIDKANLPYFYEVTMVSAGPIPTSVYLPGFDVVDSAQGAKIVKAAGSEATTINATIANTVNNAETGQRFKPTVTCGPYQFVSFESQVVLVEINPNFKTTFDNLKPKIKQVQIKSINQDTNVDQVIQGEVDLVSGVIEGAKIDAAKAASDKVSVSSYARNGYGLLAMTCYYGPTQYKEVRQAIGFLFDRGVFLTQFLGGYGTLVNGPYGEAQWFFQQSKDELDAALIQYTLNADEANARLDLSPYKYEADGTTPFDKSKASSTAEYFRHDADGEVLQINHLGTTNNEVTVIVGLQLADNAWKAGIKYTTVEAEFDELLNHFYYGSRLPEDERQYHMFNLATNFSSAYDPFWSWHSTLAGTTNNPYGLQDEELDEIMETMQILEPTATEEFRELFVDFVVRWNELLPNLPLYSNEYFDIYSKDLKGLHTTPVWSWAKDICNLSFE